MAGHQRNISSLIWRPILIINNVSSITDTRKNIRKAKYKKQNTKGGQLPGGRKSATKFLCVNAISDKVVRHSLPYLSVKNRQN